MRGTVLLITVIASALEAVCGSEQPKRHVPSGFTGVRGKKSIPDSAYAEDTQSLNNILPEEVADGSLVDKRAPSGFMGMRGKKPFPDPDGFPEGMFKRAPSGFVGMRGKKDMELSNLVDEYSKRAPSGFMGMRGKKEYFSTMADEIKRAQMSGFFGMRGKKQPGRSGFFGMRGKKYPYEFRGKFVGVRGKKSNGFDEVNYLSNEANNAQDLEAFAEGLDLNQLMLLLTDDHNNGVVGNGLYNSVYGQGGV